jgi:hypothetical protein
LDTGLTSRLSGKSIVAIDHQAAAQVINAGEVQADHRICVAVRTQSQLTVLYEDDMKTTTHAPSPSTIAYRDG